MKHSRFKDLGIVSAKKPKNTHLWWVISTILIYMVDSSNPKVLLKSIDKGENWTTVETRTFNIIGAWHDRANNKIYFVDGDDTFKAASDDFASWFITTTSGSENVTEMGSHNNGNGYIMVADIIKLDTDFYILGTNYNAADDIEYGLWKWVDPNWVFQVGHGSINIASSEWATGSFGLPVSTTDIYYWRRKTSGGNSTISFIKWTTAPGETTLKAFGVDEYDPPSTTSRNQFGIAYDNSDIFFMILKKNADGNNYLVTYSITAGDATENGQYDIVLMLDRNNIGTAPNEFEKGFSLDSSETVYEITAKRGGVRILQNMSAITDAVIIAITDNFLMNNDGDMFEFTDVTNEISTIRYNDGIVGILKKGVFTVHPDFHINWNKRDSIKIYDDNDLLEFHGLITDKNRNARGIYVFKIDSFTNEIYRKTYEKAYSGDDTDTKQKDIIDNACDFCYRSSSIVGTTTNYDYVYNRAIIYLFWLARFLERQVPYIEPDGKIWTKTHGGFAKNDMIYPGKYNFKDVAVGTAGTSINWVDNSSNDADVFIIAGFGGHRNILQVWDGGVGGASECYHTFASQSTAGWVEFWFAVSNANAQNRMFLREDVGARIWFEIDNDRFEYDAGAGILPVGLAAVADKQYHVYLQWYADNTFDLWIDGTQYLNGVSTFADFTGSGINRWYFDQDTASPAKIYVDTPISSLDNDPAYTKGDNEVAWDINNNWQDVQFIDIPGIEEVIQGFFDGNSGITRNTIRYRDNAITIRPVAATRDPIEQLKGILPLNEFRDPKIEDSTEADQLGDNRYAIWSADTLFLGLRVLGQGYLQPGKTIHVENTGQITVAESNLLLLSFVRDPKNDVYSQMILSDNIILPSEFTNLADSSPQQTHTSIVQSFENQADIIAHLTKEGGLALRLTNKTGVNSIKGTIVEAHAGTDNAFRVCDANSVESFAIVYEDGVPDGSECLIIVGGRCQVLLKDATASTRNNWVQTSDVPGRADATNASPAASPQHFREIGHAIESKGADTNVLAYMMLHFL